MEEARRLVLERLQAKPPKLNNCKRMIEQAERDSLPYAQVVICPACHGDQQRCQCYFNELSVDTAHCAECGGDMVHMAADGVCVCTLCGVCTPYLEGFTTNRSYACVGGRWIAKSSAAASYKHMVRGQNAVYQLTAW